MVAHWSVLGPHVPEQAVATSHSATRAPLFRGAAARHLLQASARALHADLACWSTSTLYTRMHVIDIPLQFHFEAIEGFGITGSRLFGESHGFWAWDLWLSPSPRKAGKFVHRPVCSHAVGCSLNKSCWSPTCSRMYTGCVDDCSCANRSERHKLLHIYKCMHALLHAKHANVRSLRVMHSCEPCRQSSTGSCFVSLRVHVPLTRKSGSPISDVSGANATST